MVPDELEDTAVPNHHHLEEALARPLRVLIAVFKDALAIFGHLEEDFSRGQKLLAPPGLTLN